MQRAASDARFVHHQPAGVVSFLEVTVEACRIGFTRASTGSFAKRIKDRDPGCLVHGIWPTDAGFLGPSSRGTIVLRDFARATFWSALVDDPVGDQAGCGDPPGDVEWKQAMRTQVTRLRTVALAL